MNITPFIAGLTYIFRRAAANRALEKALDTRNVEAVRKILHTFPKQSNCVVLNSRTARKFGEFQLDRFIEQQKCLSSTETRVKKILDTSLPKDTK